jgi:hypothetical protein
MQEFTDSREDSGDRLIVVLELVLKLAELLSQGLVRSEQIAQLRESAHDIDPMAMARPELRTLAAWIAPCSMKAQGNLRRPP